MKKLKTTLIACAGLFICLSANAQTSKNSYGVKAGASISTTSQDDYNMKTGLTVGFVVDREISRNMFIRSGIDFTMKGAKSDHRWRSEASTAENPIYSEYVNEYRLNYLQVPLLFGYKTQISDGVLGYINAGPYIGFGIYGSSKTTNRTIETKTDKEEKHVYKSKGFDDVGFHKFDLGISGSIGVEYSKYFINVGYEYGFINVEKAGDGGGDYSWHNMTATASIGYKF